ncbi:hypothetical protein YC2023_102113 [Brassica napus]
MPAGLAGLPANKRNQLPRIGATAHGRCKSSHQSSNNQEEPMTSSDFDSGLQAALVQGYVFACAKRREHPTGTKATDTSSEFLFNVCFVGMNHLYKFGLLEHW